MPGDDGWDEARRAWSLLVEQRPRAVVEVVDADDVRRAVRWAVRQGCQVTAQPVGHGANDALDDVLLLRTRALGSVEVDTTTSTARVGAGVKAGELLAALDGTGLTFLAGSSPDPTVVGLTISGGVSWFGRTGGLAANAIVSADLVDGFGRERHVTADTDPDLFWAIRGGGGDFGIITAIEIRLLPAGELYGGRLFWPLDQLPLVLRAFREVTAKAPDALSVWCAAMRFPPLEMIPEPFRGKGFASVALTYLGSAPEAERYLQPLRAVPGLVHDLVRPLPMHALGEVTMEPVHPMPIMARSIFVGDLGDDVIDSFTDVVGAEQLIPLTVVEIRHLGGAFARPVTDAGACGHIDQPYLLFALGMRAQPEMGPAISAGLDRVVDAINGHTNGRTVPNFLSAGEDLSRACSPQTRPRLADIKRRVDPRGTIRSNRGVGR